MSIPQYLAMTAGDFSKCPQLPPHTAWMAAHFSASGQGLSNRPDRLPPESLLIMDDQLPWHGHSLELVCQETVTTLKSTQANGLLLDFEREPEAQTLLLANALARCCHALGCAIGMPPKFLGDQPAAVFLPPLPCWIPPRQALEPYWGREIWLEASPTGCRASIGPDGTVFFPEDAAVLEAEAVKYTVHEAPLLGCRYYSTASAGRIRLGLYDTWEGLQEKQKLWEELGVTLTISIWRQARETLNWQTSCCPKPKV